MGRVGIGYRFCGMGDQDGWIGERMAEDIICAFGVADRIKNGMSL